MEKENRIEKSTEEIAKDQNVIICGLSVEEIEALKQEYGFLILATITQGNQTHHAIFKEPNFNTLESTRKISKTDEVKASKTLYNNCIVKADQAIKDRDYLKLKAVESVGKHMQSFTVETKNL